MTAISIPTDHPATYTLATTTVWLGHYDTLPPLPDWDGKPMRVQRAVITWRWDHKGWVFHGIKVHGFLLREKDNTMTDRESDRSQYTWTSIENMLPAEYQPLIEKNRPHAWTPFPPPAPPEAGYCAETESAGP
ncbi:hypothetical protein OHA25_61000 (plasmid) [Nonomuraea sp. NBC_00507]|uniref:hypothetical protein n=1 Tax=Nonomuraea sp. NBC_00507 TaxID=2976002 RepID=UPI002E18D3BA